METSKKLILTMVMLTLNGLRENSRRRQFGSNTSRHVRLPRASLGFPFSLRGRTGIVRGGLRRSKKPAPCRRTDAASDAVRATIPSSYPDVRDDRKAATAHREHHESRTRSGNAREFG